MFRPAVAEGCGNETAAASIVEMMSESPPSHERSQRLDLAGLFERERAPMLHLACLLVGSRSIAEEIVQDAFVVVGERWAELEKPGAYLRSTVVNGCRIALRRRATERRYAYYDAATVDAPTEDSSNCGPRSIDCRNGGVPRSCCVIS